MGRGTTHTARITRLLQLCVEEGGLAGAAGVEEERSYAHTKNARVFLGGQSGYTPSAMKPRVMKLSKYNAVSRKPQPPNGPAYIYN